MIKCNCKCDFTKKCEFEFQPNTATVGKPMVWVWGFGWPMANGWLYEKPVCKQSVVFTTHLNNTIWRLSVATISTPLVLAIAYYLLSSFFANLTPSQCPFHSLSLTLFLSLLFQQFLLHHLFCLPPVLPFILSLALFILNTAWQSILKSQEGCSFPFAQWGDPSVKRVKSQLKEQNKRSLQLSIPLLT